MDCSKRLQPVDIGPVRIEDPVILAPMSGVTDMPFRQMVKRGGAGLVVSEMIASAAMVRENRKTLLMAKNSPEEFPMSVQLAGCEPEKLSIVLNGIVENYRELKESLLADGHTFTSETDTEVLAHLIETKYHGDLVEVIRQVVEDCRATGVPSVSPETSVRLGARYTS